MMYEQLTNNKGVKWSVGIVDNKVIDTINILQVVALLSLTNNYILQATFTAMTEAVLKLTKDGGRKSKYHVLIDGNRVPPQLLVISSLYSVIISNDQ